MIDILKKVPGAKYFRWKEFLLLRRLGTYHSPSEEEKQNIITIAGKLDLIREIFDAPIKITSGIRPTAYNTLIGGADLSAHISGEGVDFVVEGFSCDSVREILKDKLEDLGVRIEDKPGSTWVHMDIKPVKYKRFFKP